MTSPVDRGFAQAPEDFEYLPDMPLIIGERLSQRLKELPSTQVDNGQVLEFAQILWQHLEQADSVDKLAPDEQVDFALATTLADIGKSGPACSEGDASCILQRNMTRAVYEFSRLLQSDAAPDKTLRQFFDACVSKDLCSEDEVQQYIVALNDQLVPGLSPDSTLRAYYNLHTQYTLDLLLDAQASKEINLSERVILAAAAHHWVQGQDNIPKLRGTPIVDSSTGEYQVFGERRKFDKVGVWVMLLDKYEANISRSPYRDLDPEECHAAAIQWLREFVQRTEIFSKLNWLKLMFDKAIELLDQARPYEIFRQIHSSAPRDGGVDS